MLLGQQGEKIISESYKYTIRLDLCSIHTHGRGRTADADVSVDFVGGTFGPDSPQVAVVGHVVVTVVWGSFFLALSLSISP